jgi:hypothetical protein
VDAGSAVPDGGCASRRRPRKRCDHSAMRQGCRAASRLWLAGATRVAGSTAMSSSFSAFLFAASVQQIVV